VNALLCKPKTKTTTWQAPKKSDIWPQSFNID